MGGQSPERHDGENEHQGAAAHPRQYGQLASPRQAQGMAVREWGMQGHYGGRRLLVGSACAARPAHRTTQVSRKAGRL